jgi:uncharacterized membrane protein YidH (DUF202 family)
MTWLAILAVGLTSILPIYGQQQSSQTTRHQNSSHNTKSPDQRTSSPIAPAGIPVIKQQPSATQADRSTSHPQSYLSRLFSPENLPNIALVIAGFAGIIVAVCTLRKIERQTKAAEVNIQALVSTERAWIVISVDSVVAGEFRFWAKNEGKTPARVVSIWSCNIPLRREETLTIPPDEQTSESLLQSPPCLIPPAAKRIIWQCTVADFQKASGGGTEEQSFFGRGFVLAYIFGRIRYFDVLDTKATVAHETRWLYWLMPLEDALPFADPTRPDQNTYT